MAGKNDPGIVSIIKTRLKNMGKDPVVEKLKAEARETTEDVNRNRRKMGYQYFEDGGSTRLGKRVNGVVEFTPNPVNNPNTNKLNKTVK